MREGPRMRHNPRSRFATNESGATAIEYSLIAALIAMVLVVSLTLIGVALSGIFAGIAAALAP